MAPALERLASKEPRPVWADEYGTINEAAGASPVDWCHSALRPITRYAVSRAEE
jgi:hypothetical protein